MGVGKCFLNPFCLVLWEQFPVDELWMGSDQGLMVLVHVAVNVLILKDVDFCREAC